jgi:hypothetical protein
MEIKLADDLPQEIILNNINEQNEEATFEKLKRIQLLLKKESSLKQICNKKYRL